MQTNNAQRRRSMEFMLKSINTRANLLPRLREEKPSEQQSSNLRFSRRYIPSLPSDFLSYNPLCIDKDSIRTYKKPVLFQLNFQYNRTSYSRRPQEKDIKQLRRLEVQNYERNNLLLVTVGNRKSIIQYGEFQGRPDHQQISFQQKLSHVLMTKSELQTKTPATNNYAMVAAEEGLESMTINIAEPNITQEKIVHVRPAPEKRRNLQFSNHDNSYKFFVGPGNNGQLVKKILQARGWTETCESNSMFNLKWTQTCERIRFDHISSGAGHKQLVNHFEFHEEISTKSGLIRNLKAVCERDQKNSLFEVTPITFEVDFTSENCDNDLKRFLYFYLENSPKRNQIPKGKRKEEDHKSFMDFVKGIKHIHNMQNLTYEKKEHPNSKPAMKPIYLDGETYLWLLKPTDLNRGRGIYLFRSLEELSSILEEYYKRSEKHVIKSPSRRHSSAKDKSREVETTTNALVNQNKYIKSQSFVIQKYIERPMLVNKRKYDIRVWVLLTHEMDLYFFKEGYIRTSCEEFSLDKDDLYVHLTNNAVQKYSNNYGNYQKGNQLSFDDIEAVFELLEKNGGQKVAEEQQDSTASSSPQKLSEDDNQAGSSPSISPTATPRMEPATSRQTVPLMDPVQQKYAECVPPGEKPSFRKHILPEMKRLINFSIESVKKKLNSNDRHYTFEIYGYDFMIDERLKPWLIEVNTNPCIEESSPILEKLLPRMLHNAFQLTLDVLFPPKSKNLPSISKLRYPVPNYPDDESMWELLGSYRIQRRRGARK